MVEIKTMKISDIQNASQRNFSKETIECILDDINYSLSVNIDRYGFLDVVKHIPFINRLGKIARRLPEICPHF